MTQGANHVGKSHIIPLSDLPDRRNLVRRCRAVDPAQCRAGHTTINTTCKAGVDRAEAQALLDQIGQTYTDAKALSLVGKISLDFDAGGDQKHETTDFTASFVARINSAMK